MASTFSFNKIAFFFSESNTICYLSQNIIIEQQPIGNFMFSGEMSEDAPVQLGVVRPPLLGTQRTCPTRPLKDLSYRSFAVLPEMKFFVKKDFFEDSI